METRKQQIHKAASEKYVHNLQKRGAFVAGASWADAHPQSPWISVSDKMPEEFEVVIAYAANGHIENSYLDGHYWTGDFYDTTVIYWMPLPKLFQL